MDINVKGESMNYSAQIANMCDYRDQANHKIVMIASGKGGVGKTWFTATLAHIMSMNKKRVLLFDGDLGLANLDIQLGLYADKDLGGIVDGTISFHEAITEYKEGNFDIIVGRSGFGYLANISPARLSIVREEIRHSASDYDFILMDLGAGIGDNIQSLANISGQCLLVLTDEPTSLTDAYAFIKVIKRSYPALHIKIIVNQVDSLQSGKQIYNGFASVCQKFLKFAPDLGGIIRKDNRVKHSIRQQESIVKLYPNSRSIKDVSKIYHSVFC